MRFAKLFFFESLSKALDFTALPLAKVLRTITTGFVTEASDHWHSRNYCLIAKHLGFSEEMEIVLLVN